MILKSLRTKQLDKNLIKKICKLKNSFWIWNLKKQIEWFNENIKIKDIHNLLFNKKKLIGYTLLRYRKVCFGKKNVNYYYFDTMIIDSKERNKNYGKHLMFFNNKIIKKKGVHSFLITPKKNINFYKKYNWNLIKKKNFEIMDHKPKWLKKKKDINGMTYNLNKNLKTKGSYYLNN